MRTLYYFFCSAIFILFLIINSVCGQQSKSDKPFSFIVFGDMPYTLPADYPHFEKLINIINQQNQLFNVHMGDFKSSKTDCSDSIYKIAYNYFQTFDKPLIYTPGDNEWTDCNKNNPGKYDIEERLGSIRKMFYNGKTSLGKNTLPLTSQTLDPKFSTYIENNRWEHSNVSFATIHLVGTNNNFVVNNKNSNAEFYNRNEADIAWLNEVFDNATTKNHSSVVLFIHAEIFADEVSKDGSGFTSFKDILRARVQKFNKPVLLLNGDSHTFLTDKPLLEVGKSKKVINNFTRLQVFGENDMHAIKITIDPGSTNPFMIQELIIEGN